MLSFDAIGADAIGTAGASTTAPIVALTGAPSTQQASSSTGSATVTPAPPGTVNLTGASTTQNATSGTGAAVITPANSQTGGVTITVPASRTAVFVTRSRIAVFTGTAPVTLYKVAADQLYTVADLSKDANDAATTIASVLSVVTGVTLMEGPTIQGNLLLMKVGALDVTPGALNSITLRTTLANGEQLDRTILFNALDDRSQQFGKDPDDKRFYAFDVSAELALSSGTTISAVSTPTAIGVSSLAAPVIQGEQVIVKIGGLDTSTSSAVNSCELAMTLATTEVIYRKIYFSRQDH